nr:hypothetical protein [Tanacetum cinerariifolium]
MTRSSTSELFTQYKEHEREFQSSRRYFMTLSLDELRSHDFNLFSDQEYSQEEVAKTMAATMEQYMSKTRADYGSGIARPKNFELKGQFLKELRTNTFSGLDHEDANEHIKKVLEIVDLLHILNISIDQVMLRAFPISLTGAASYCLRNEPTAIQAQLNNLGREIKKVNEKVYVAQVRCKQCKGPHYTKDCPLKKKGKPSRKLTTHNLVDLFKEEDIEQQLRDSIKGTTLILRAIIIVTPLLTYLNLGLGELAHTKLTVELADMTMKYPKGIADNVLVGIGKFVFPIDFIILYMPEDIKVLLILERPFLSIARAKIDVYKRKITLRVGEERIIFTSVKPASSLIKRVYMLSLRERIELDLEARLMGETLVRNQGDDLMPTIEEGKVIEEFRTRDDELDTGIDDYPSYCDYDNKIHIDYFTVLEDMDAYRDEGIGDVIFGKPYLREVGIKTRQLEGMITIYNGNDEVTYQMMRSHLRFKHHTNEQHNKIPPLVKVSDKDKKNRVSHPYQKLKGFYKGVLNLGPDYTRDAKTKE